MALVYNPAEGTRLLSLDGGGIKGISSLWILKAIMDRVGEIERETKFTTSKASRLPVDHFQMAAGTSTGGIIAFMLMRLRMSVDNAIKEYNEIGPKVVGELATSGEARFPSEPLEKAIDDIVSNYDKVTREQMRNAGKTNQPKPEVPQMALVDNKAKM